ncbi:hypothetical protein ABIC83_002973 [Roseateles asaccharophilus]|uniref:hypothetical protein n=1 Tax=Roseateles asaccharophilus TaxID=582607 RepID=UPI0038374595
MTDVASHESAETVLLRMEAKIGLVGARFLLAAGRAYDVHAPANDFRDGEKQACYANSLHLALAHPELVYVEGRALSHGVVPMEHAWNVDASGLIVDSTWDTRDGGYFGVAFKADWVLARVEAQGHYSVLAEVFPEYLLHEDPAVFLAAPTPEQVSQVRDLFSTVLKEIGRPVRGATKSPRMRP